MLLVVVLLVVLLLLLVVVVVLPVTLLQVVGVGVATLVLLILAHTKSSTKCGTNCAAPAPIAWHQV